MAEAVAAPTLDALGSRICVMGPSGSGKSTLARAIAAARTLPPVHLDRLHHLPNTDWQQRPADEFAALHDTAIGGDRWVIDGNYSALLPQRLDRATGVILLDIPTIVSLARYLRRSWFDRNRAGALDGAKDSVKWVMIRHILGATRTNRRRYRTIVASLALPVAMLPSRRAVAAFYRREGLDL